MRGKVAKMTLFEGLDARDDLGRLVSDSETNPQNVRGSVNAPSTMKMLADATVQLDAVAHIPPGAVVTPSTWVRVTEAPAVRTLGDYSVATISGGRRVLRLGLVRRQRRDGTHGHH